MRRSGAAEGWSSQSQFWPHPGSDGKGLNGRRYWSIAVSVAGRGDDCCFFRLIFGVGCRKAAQCGRLAM